MDSRCHLSPTLPRAKAPAAPFLPPRGRRATHQPRSTPPRGQSPTRTASQGQAGPPEPCPQQPQGTWRALLATTRAVPAACLQASSAPSEDLAPLQPRALHFLLASLDLLHRLRAQPLHSCARQHGSAAALLTASTVSTIPAGI